MTDIRDLLREATDDLRIDEPDAVGRVRRATTRHRRNLAAVAGVVALVAAAIIVPLALVSGTGSSGTAPAGPKSPRPMAQNIKWLTTVDGDATPGFGKMWALACCDRISGTSWIDELDPVTGRRIARVDVATPTSRIAAGAGYVWVIGSNAGGGGPSSISAIDPRTLHVISMHISDRRAEPYEIAFADGSAWVSVPMEDAVWRLTPSTGDRLAKNVLTVSGAPSQITTTGSGAIWVERLDVGRLTRILPTATSGHLGQTVSWPGDIFSAAGPGTLWVTAGHGGRTVLQLAPSDLSHCDACAETDTRDAPAGVNAVISNSRGVFVSSFPDPQQGGTVSFWSWRDVNRTREQPTARFRIGGTLAIDGDGVVIGTEGSGVLDWTPPS